MSVVFEKKPAKRLKRLVSAQLNYLKLIFGNGSKAKYEGLKKELRAQQLTIERK